MRNLQITFALFAASALAGAQTFSLNDVVNWTGSGSNEAALLIDWNDGSTHPALVWGYRWDGTATGEQMFDAIIAADPDLYVQIETYSFGDAVYGIGFDGSAYGAGGPGSHYEGDPSFAQYWGYFIGSGTTYPAWNYADVGFSDQVLSNLEWDGWSWLGDAPADQPVAAPLSTPEPGSIFGLAAPLALFVRKKRT